jgi:hypothetical protein
MNTREIALLIGDNPFHGISHLSQERARVRGNTSTHFENAANLVLTSLQNGANGFMFSVSETTLAILSEIHKKERINSLSLYAIVPYAYEYVRLATKVGGISGLAKKLAKEITVSRNMKTAVLGLRGVMRADPAALLKAYLNYEISRIKSATGKQANLHSVMLHEVVTDMALAINLEWLFKVYVDFTSKQGIMPGFNTGNFPYFVNKFKEWDMDLSKIVIAAPFNRVGFQMNPSKEECEKTLESIPESTVIAISILAAGYLNLSEAAEYVATLPNIGGVAVGISKEKHAYETFRIIKEKLC